MYNIDYDFVAEYCKKYYKETCDAMIKKANDISKNTFIFDMPWDMERTSEPTHFADQIDWTLIKNGDKEFLFQLNRHRFLIILAEAYALTKNESYVSHIKRLMLDFINSQKVRYDNGDHPWRSLEVGLRGEYWTKAFQIVKDSSVIDDNFKKVYYNSLDEHAKVLVKEHSNRQKLSNWGVIQDHGLFDIGVELGNDDYIKIALERLEEQSNLQLFSDGVHWEQSAMYHNEVLNCFLDVILRARAKNIKLPKKLVENAKRMAYVNIAWIKPNYKQPLFGDSDYTYLYDIMAQSALIFDDPYLKYFASERLDYASLWLFGKKGVEEYDKIEKRCPHYNSIALSDSGNYVMREDFSHNSNYLFFHNGYTGGGHAHNDKLSFDFSIGEDDYIVDTGRYTYKPSDRVRKHTKSYKGHNTLIVDKKDFIKFRGWAYYKKAIAIKQDMIIEKDFELVKGCHLGYLKNFGAVLPSRKILWIKPNIYIIIDTFYSKGLHRYTQTFNIDKDRKISVDKNRVVLKGDNSKLYMYFDISKSKLKVKEGLYSEHYNGYEKISTIYNDFSAFGTKSYMTILIADKENDKFSVEKVDTPNKNTSLAVRIRHNDDEYLMFYSAKELMKCVTIGDKPFTASLSYYKNNEYKIIEW